MYGLKVKFVAALFAIFLINGCGSSSSSSTPEAKVVSSATQETTLNDSQFSDGVVTSDVKIAAETKDGKKVVETTLSEGTTFTDSKGNAVTSAPQISISQNETTANAVSDGKSTNTNVVKTELKLVDKDGNKIIPSKPVTIAMQAPAGSKPGDEVKVDLPEGATASKRAEKLIVVVVGADGNIHVTLIPQIFKDFTVILIVIKKIVTVPVTGGAGGN